MQKQTIFISGMTCKGCEKSVKKAFENLTHVANVIPNYQTGEVEINANQHITTAEITAILPKKFALIDETPKQPSKLKQLSPLFLIFGFIVLTILTVHRESLETNPMMHDFMAMFFMVFSFFKLLDLSGFQSMFKTYDPLAAAWPIYGWIYPFIELALGILYLIDFVPPYILITTIIALGITTVGVIRVLLKKQNIQCACLGSVLKLPMTEATFIENAIMLVMAVRLLA